MSEENAMSERILRKLEHIFLLDTELKEFSVILVDENNRNKCPVVYENHYLGLESWCGKHVLHYAHTELFKARHALHQGRLSFDKTKNLNHLLIGALLLKPCTTTLWNMRRRLFLKHVVDFDAELRFVRIVLTQHAKSSEAFAYRKWIIDRMLSKISEDEIRLLLENELLVCEMAAEKAANNYHAWNYRIWCLEKVGEFGDRLILSELEFSAKWIAKHVSEHAGYHYRQILLKCVGLKNFPPRDYRTVLLTHLKVPSYSKDANEIIVYLLGKPSGEILPKDTSERVNFFLMLLYELYFVIHEINAIYTGHESLWMHRRFVIYFLLKACYDYHSLDYKRAFNVPNLDVNSNDNIVDTNTSSCLESGEKLPKIIKTSLNKVERSHLYKTIVHYESEILKDNAGPSNPIQCYYVKRHEKWLTAMGVQLNAV